MEGFFMSKNRKPEAASDGGSERTSAGLPWREDRPRGWKAMLDSAVARALLRDVPTGAWPVGPFSGWKWAKWSSGDVGWLSADVELPTTLQVSVRRDPPETEKPSPRLRPPANSRDVTREDVGKIFVMRFANRPGRPSRHHQHRYDRAASQRRASGGATIMSASLGKDRRYFIGGSDARVIMGDDEAAPLRLWREKRGEVEPEDLSGNLIVQLGLATEKLNRRWYQSQTGRVITGVQQWRRHPTLHWMAATLESGRWRRCIRSQVHVAVAVLRRSGRSETCCATAT
jgi:YqaJ-like viral recombinase domain